MKIAIFILFIFSSICNLCVTSADHHNQDSLTSTSIVFSTIGRTRYAFDIFSLPINPTAAGAHELRLTDGRSVNFNGYFPSSLPSFFHDDQALTTTNPATHIVYVTERKGSSAVVLDTLYSGSTNFISKGSVPEASETESTRSSYHLVGDGEGQVSMKDRPSLVGDSLIYVSTHEDSGVERTSWTAVYSTQLRTGSTRRLTPYGVADYSPAVSPSGVWTAVASSGEKNWDGGVQELNTEIYIFLTQDGSKRVKVVEHGGWPSWIDDTTFYFHRKSEDGWWSIYKAVLPENESFSVNSVVTHRVTPPGLHSFTPAASAANRRFVAVATRRPNSDFRHIEIYDVVSRTFKDLTRVVAPRAHHYNPFISPDGLRVGYHKCRGSGSGSDENKRKNDLFLENIQTPRPGISLFRIDGSSPSFSPDGKRIAYVGLPLPGLYVSNSDGSGQREIIPDVAAFSTGWNPKRKGIVYISVGPILESEETKVDVVAVDVDELSYKKLTTNGKNNAFPAASPDGKWVVFRSGRTGHKNLYIMDADKGEPGGLTRLTEGAWSDTMPNWSPDGDWIAFASDRHNPGSGSFALYLIHPNGTGLRQLIHSGSGGRANHPCFSPDGKYIVFTSDYAGVSAEPVSYPNHFQPYGEIFTIKLDGSDLRRLTHNSYEDGTPSWGPKFVEPVDVERSIDVKKCSFDDCLWLDVSKNNDNNALQKKCLAHTKN